MPAKLYKRMIFTQFYPPFLTIQAEDYSPLPAATIIEELFKMKLAKIPLFIIILLIYLTSSGRYARADEDYKYALALMQERREYKNAADKFAEYIQDNPDSAQAPRALFYMASCLAHLGKDSSAGNAYERILKLYPASDNKLLLEACAYGADAYFRAELFKKASELYSNLIDKFPESPQAESSLYWLAESLNHLAMSAQRRPDDPTYQRAIRSYLKLHTAYPTSRFLPDALTSAGILAYNFKDYENSSYFFSLYDELDIELDPQKQELITYHNAESLYWLKNYEQAKKKFESVITNYPQGHYLAQSYAGIGWCNYALKNIEAAAQAFSKAAELYTDPVTALSTSFDAGAAYEEIGATEKAINEYKKVVAAVTHPQKQAALIRLSILQKGELAPELSALLSQTFNTQSDNDNTPQTLEAGILLAENELDKQEYHKARTILTRIIEIAPDSDYAPFAIYQLALAESKLGRYKEASAAIKRLLKNYPETPLRLQAAYAIADYQKLLGDTEKSNIAYKWLAEESENWAKKYLAEHQVDDAEKFTRDARDIAAASLLRLAETLFKESNNPEAQNQAKDYFSLYITRYPDNSRLGAALLRLGELTEQENPEIAHNYFKNAANAAERAIATDPDTAEISRIRMHAAYRLCLNNFLLAQQARDIPGEHQTKLKAILKSIDQFSTDYATDPSAAELLSQLKYYKSEAEYALGDIAAARNGYEESYQLHKDSTIADAALFSSAWIDQQQGNIPAAIQKLKKLIVEYKNSPYAAKALYILAIHSRKQHELEVAENYLIQLLNNFPESEFTLKAHIEQANLLNLKQANTQAIALLQKLHQEAAGTSEYPDILYTLARIYWSQSEEDTTQQTELYPKITALLSELLKTYPDYKNNTLARFRLGEIEFNRSEYTRALNWYREILQQPAEPLADKAHYRLAWCYLKLASEKQINMQKALNEFLAIYEQYPESEIYAESALRAGKILQHNHEYAQALELFSTAEKKTTDQDIMVNARYARGTVQLELGEYSSALHIFTELLTDYPASPLTHEANWGAGQASLLLGATRDAADYFNAAKADNYSGQAAAKARFGLGMIAMEENNFKGAREEFRKIDVFLPHCKEVAAEALLKAAEASRQLGEIEPAVNDLKRIISDYADTASAQIAEEELLAETEL